MKGIFQCSKIGNTNLQSGATHFPACYGKFTSQSVAIVFYVLDLLKVSEVLDFVQG